MKRPERLLHWSDLAGLSGTMEIHVAEEGKHTLALDYPVG